jgi:hypothetical protein
MNKRRLRVFLTAELACAIASRCRATGVRQPLRTDDAAYKTVLRQAQPQVRPTLADCEVN